MGTRQPKPQQAETGLSRLYRVVYVLGVAGFALAFVLGVWYSLRTTDALPPVTDDFGWDRLDPTEDADELIRELEMYLEIGPVGDVLSARAIAGRRVELGRIWQSKGQLDTAADNYQRAVELFPYSATVHFELARVFQQQQRLDDAAMSYQIALQLDPQLWDAHRALGTILAGQGDWQRAAWHFSQILAARPRDPEAHYDMGRALLEIGQPRQAAQHFEQALQLKPGWQLPQDQLRRLQAES